MMTKILELFRANKFYVGVVAVTILVVLSGSFFYSHRIPRKETGSIAAEQTKLEANIKNAKGARDAPVTIIEFSDLECPACAQAQVKLNKVISKHPTEVQLIYRHYPLRIHKNSRAAAKAAEAAGSQGKFFEMIDLLYKNQNKWADKTDPTNTFAIFADELNLNIELFMKDVAKDWNNINTDHALGDKMGVKLTPTFFINGKIFPGVMSEQELETEIGQYLEIPESTSTSETLGQ